MSQATPATALLWLALSSASAAQAPAGNTLTADDAVRTALANNRQIEVARLEVAKAQTDGAALRTRKRPAFEVNVQSSELLRPVEFLFPRGLFGDYPGVGPLPGSDTVLSTPMRPITFVYAVAGQPLTQLRRIGLGIDASEVAVIIAREQVRWRQQAIAGDVRRAFYGIAHTKAAIAAADESVTTYRELDRTTSEYVAQQVLLRADALDVKARLARAEYTAVQLRNGLETQKEQLNVLMGREPSVDFDVTGLDAAGSGSSATTLEAARARALADRPEMRQARLRIDQADLDRRAKKTEFVPDVSLSLTYLSPFNVEFVPKNFASFGLSGKWEPFDWGRKSRELASKTATVSQARLALADTEEQVRIDVSRRWRAVDEARLLLAANQAALDAAQERLRVVKDRFAKDAALLRDVLPQQAAVADAVQSYQQSLAAFWTARAELQRALGEDVP